MIYYNEEVKFQLVVNLEDENDMVKEYMSDYLYELEVEVDSPQDDYYYLEFEDSKQCDGMFDKLELKLEELQDEFNDYE